MSFLLRNPKRSSNGNGRIRQDPGANSDTRILPRPRPTLSRGRNQSQQLLQRQSKQGLQSGNQILVQRTSQHSQKQHNVPNQQRLDTQSQLKATMKKQRGDQQQQQETPGVISMSEVLEDLRVLEQQQREAQRKLANARVTKEHRLQQHAALESKLEHLKYSNGELRAQLRQSREILSCGTRELGTRRLAAGRAGDDIRDFERKLKKGLHSARMITACRRKIDSLIIVVENKEAVLVRLKAEAKDKLNVFEKKMREAQRHEQMLRTTVQQEVARAQTFAEEVATLRTENTQLEQEMLEAQNMEESTRLREASVEAQITSERKRHQELAAQLTVQIEDCQKADQKATSEQEILTKELEEKAQELHNAKQRIVNYQQEEGHNSSPVSADPQEPVPLFDRKRLELALEAETNAARANAAANDALRQSIEQLRVDLKKTEEETYHNKANASSLSASAQDKKATEVVRRVVLESFQKDLERDRDEVCKLEKSSKDLEKVRAQETSRHSQLVSECEAAIQKDREATETAKRDLEAESIAAEKNITSWENEKNEICRRVEDAKDRAKAMEKALDNSAENEKGRGVENESNFQENVRGINESKEAHGEKTKSQISRLLQKYPELEKVKFTVDSTKSREEQAVLVLGSLVTEFEAKIVAAKESREAKIKQCKEARRQAEAAAAEVKRKEEERRKNRERLQAEIQRQEEEERRLEEERLESQTRHRQEEIEEQRRNEDRRHAEEQRVTKSRKEEVDRQQKPRRRSMELKKSHQEEAWQGGPRKEDGGVQDEKGGGPTEKNSAASATHNKASHARQLGRKRKGADFFFPQSQDDLSEEETPAHPKQLLPAFTRADNPAPSTALASISQGSDKRVRWEDQDDSDDHDGDDSSQESTTLPNQNAETESTKTVSCGQRQYGTSSKGLIAISCSKNTTAASQSIKTLSTAVNRPHESDDDNCLIHEKSDDVQDDDEPWQDPEASPDQNLDAELTKSASRRKKQYGSSKKGLATISCSKSTTATSRSNTTLSSTVNRECDSDDEDCDRHNKQKSLHKSKHKRVCRADLGLSNSELRVEVDHNKMTTKKLTTADKGRVLSETMSKLSDEPRSSLERRHRDNLVESNTSRSKLLQKNRHKGESKDKSRGKRETQLICDSSKINSGHKVIDDPLIKLTQKDGDDSARVSKKKLRVPSHGDSRKDCLNPSADGDERRLNGGQEGSNRKAKGGETNERISPGKERSELQSLRDRKQRKSGSKKGSGSSKNDVEASRQKSTLTQGTRLSSKLRAGNLSEQRKPGKESRLKRQKNFDQGVLDSLAIQKQNPDTSNIVKRSSSTSRPTGATSRSGGSKVTNSMSSRSRISSVTTKKTGATRKRKSDDFSSTQTSGLSSSEGATKTRRRKKKESSGSQKPSTKSLTDDAYDFHF